MPRKYQRARLDFRFVGTRNADCKTDPPSPAPEGSRGIKFPTLNPGLRLFNPTTVVKRLASFIPFLLLITGLVWGAPPPAPSGLLVIAESGSHFHLAWQDRSPNETGFRVERRVPGADWSAIGVLPANTTSFASTGAMPFTKYEHRVSAFNDEGQGNSEPVTSESFSLLTHRRADVIESASARQGEGTFVLLDNGDLVLFYSDMVTVSDLAEAQIAMKVSRDGGRTWGERKIVFSEPKTALFLPSALHLGDDKLLLTYARRIPGEWQSKRVARLSPDRGATWSEERVITDGSFNYSTGAHDRLYELSNGDIVSLVHSVDGKGERPRHLVTDVFGSRDRGQTWEKWTRRPLDVPLNPYGSGEYGFWECTIAELDGGELLMYGRTATGWLYGTRSSDYGRTWTETLNVGFRNPLAPPYLKRIAGTPILILLNNPIVPREDVVVGQRYVLGSRISTDGGRTWGNFKEIENHTHNWWYDYPHLLQDGDVFHLSYRAIEMTPQNRWGRVHLAHLRLPVSWFLE